MKAYTAGNLGVVDMKYFHERVEKNMEKGEKEQIVSNVFFFPRVDKKSELLCKEGVKMYF